VGENLPSVPYESEWHIVSDRLQTVSLVQYWLTYPSGSKALAPKTVAPYERL